LILDRLRRLEGLTGRARLRPSPAAAPAEPYVTLLDPGQGAVKALVLDLTARPVAVIGGASAPVPPLPLAPGTAPGADAAALPAAYVAAAERALVAAEDLAGVVPRRAVLVAAGGTPAVARGAASVRRRRPGSPVDREDLLRAVAQARAAALAAAGRFGALELLRPQRLEAVQVTLRRASLDGAPLPPFAGGPGAAGEVLDVEVDAGLAPVAGAQRLLQLAEALDLDLAGTVSLPLALAALAGVVPGGAIVIDAGAGSTTVVVAFPEGAQRTPRPPAAVTLPVGAADLEAHVGRALDVPLKVAQEVLQAHAAGALRPGRPSAAGPGAWRVVRRLAELHAGVWADTLELALAGLSRDASGREGRLPPTVLLCGGALALPELRRVVEGGAWGVTLPFARRPAPAVLRGADVPGVEDRVLALPALQAPAVLAAAAAAVRLQPV
jgi:hypothetical protein